MGSGCLGGLPPGALRRVAHVEPGCGQRVPDRVGRGIVARTAQGRPQRQERLDRRRQPVPGVGEAVPGGLSEPADEAAKQRPRLPGPLVLVGVGFPENTQSAAAISAACRPTSSPVTVKSGPASGGAIPGSAFGLVPATTRTRKPMLSAK